jgi:hypothetical protein
VIRVWTDPMPQQEVEKVAPCKIDNVVLGMEALADAARQGRRSLLPC